METTKTSENGIFDQGLSPFLIALIQGLMLLAIYQALENQVWPHGDIIATYILLSVVIPVPIMALMLLSFGSGASVAKSLALFSLLIVCIAAYVGYQLTPNHLIPIGQISSIYAVTLFVLCFKALMYLQHKFDQSDISYAKLFTYSWRNATSVALAGVFSLVFWGVLMLWAALFKVLRIDFFYTLFTNEWFFIPTLVFAFGVATTIVRDHHSLLDATSRIPQVLIKLLLPVLVVVSVSFLFTIPFKGLALLWSTGSGTLLILWLQALSLFFVNTVYRDEATDRPYSVLFHRLIYVGIALLPIYSLIAFYGLYLRVDQYGITIDRAWAFIIWFFLACFSFGYLVGIIRHRDNWIATLGRTNIRMGLVLILVMVLVNSPILDLRKLSANSLFDRFTMGEVETAELDFWYIENQLGRPGYLQVQSLKGKVKESDQTFFAKLDKLYPLHKKPKGPPSVEEFKETIVIWPVGEKVPETIIDEAYSVIKDGYSDPAPANNYIFSGDFNQNGQPNYVFINARKSYVNSYLYQEHESCDQEDATDKHWAYLAGYIDADELAKAVEQESISLVEPIWLNLKVGDTVINLGNSN